MAGATLPINDVAMTLTDVVASTATISRRKRARPARPRCSSSAT